MKKILVFCGSSAGKGNRYLEEATLLGKMLAERDIELIYGGANVGLMGALADAVLNSGGKVTGVIPQFLKAKEIVHEHLTSLILVNTLHERKAEMSKLCDGVIGLPGGFGTMDELFEMLTWSQLGLHAKPVGLLNIDGFYNPLIALLQKMIEEQFLKKVHADTLLISDHVEELLNKMQTYTAPTDSKWIER